MCMLWVGMRVCGRACLTGTAEAETVREAVWNMEATRSNSAFWSMKWEACIIGDEVAFDLGRGRKTIVLRSHTRVVGSHPGITGSRGWV